MSSRGVNFKANWNRSQAWGNANLLYYTTSVKGLICWFCIAWFWIKAIRIIVVPLLCTGSIVLLIKILLSLSFSPFFILLSFLFESISLRSYFPFIWYFILIWDFKVRRHFTNYNALTLINKQEERNSWTRAVASDLFIYENFIVLVKNESRLVNTWWQHCQKFGSKWRTRVRIESLMAAKSCKEMYGISKKIQNTTTTTHKIP